MRVATVMAPGPGDNGGLRFDQPNPHFLERIARAAESCELVAGEDIFDSAGRKLWARGQPVTRELQERLMARRLLRPLEVCLEARHAVSSVELMRAAKEALERHPAMAAMAGPGYVQVISAFGRVRLGSAPSLLLASISAQQPRYVTHAVQVALMAGILAQAITGTEVAVLDAIHAGLVHDLGEFYLDPRLLGDPRQMNFEDWRAFSVHPVIGAALLREHGGCVPTVVQAVREHHERLDGTGYPFAAPGARISALGRLLLAAEVLAALLVSRDNPDSRALLALQLIPGQFPREIVDVAGQRLRRMAFAAPASIDLKVIQQATSDMLHALQAVRKEAAFMEDNPRVEDGQRALASRARALSLQFEMALHACGAMAAADDPRLDPRRDGSIVGELYMIVREMGWRLPALSRHLELSALRAKATDPGWERILEVLALDFSSLRAGGVG